MPPESGILKARPRLSACTAYMTQETLVAKRSACDALIVVQEVLDKRDPDSIKTKRACVKRLAEIISEIMGGRFCTYLCVSLVPVKIH